MLIIYIIYILLAYKHSGVKAYKHDIYFTITPKNGDLSRVFYYRCPQIE